MRLARETWLMAGICIADLVTTIWFVNSHGASEGNPLMNYYLQMGVVPFIAAKMVFFVGPLVVLEWARQKRPLFVRNMLRVGIALYLGFYGTVVWRINKPHDSEHLTQAQIAVLESWASAPVTKQEIAMLRGHLGD
jgi:hypothetical protein